jgi:hypothetical protein
MTLWQNITVALMAGLIIAPLSAFIGAKIALRQKAQETWWGRKLDCYVGLLTHLQRLNAVHLSRATRYKRDAVPSDAETQRWAAIEDEAEAEINRCWSLSRLLLRAEVTDALEKYYSGIDTACEEQDAAAAQIAVAKGLHDAIEQIMDIAKNDLKLPK